MATIKGYKVFNPDWTCRGFQYKVGETFTHDGIIAMCKAGFHFCQKATDCFDYYSFDSNNKVAEIEAVGTVITKGDKSVTNKIRIVREISWQELLTIINTGKNCTGMRNTGDNNADNNNTRLCNSGSYNAGCFNKGNSNTGSYNAGGYNTGNFNIGFGNSGGNNIGDFNTGGWNIGDYNTGDWNSANYSSGFFNTVPSPVYIFNKPTELSREEILNCQGMKVLNQSYENSWWINSKDMTAKEKAAHPEHETTGGYLKTVDFKTACQIMWQQLDDCLRESVKQIPNFDPDIFEEITGINVNL